MSHRYPIIASICVSETKGDRKHPIEVAALIADHGIESDAHAGDPIRQVSLLAIESIEKMRALGVDVGPGGFAENITTMGIDLSSVKIGDRIQLGNDVLIEVTQIGKVCHNRCAIYYQAGDCIMPKEGVFARVVRGGRIKRGDIINVKVQMKFSMVSFLEAKSIILEKAKVLPLRNIAIEDACGFVLAEDVVSPIDLPPFDNSAMDGFAVNSVEVFGCLSVGVSQIIKAGDVPEPLVPGTCAKIMTGAMIPEGADAVVPVEDALVEGDIVALTSIKKGRHIRFKGEDVKKASIIARKGAIITSRHIALLAACGFTHVPVYPRPRVTVITTGSELQCRGQPLTKGKIYDSNSTALVAALREFGIEAKTISVVDDIERITSIIRDSLRNSDIVLTIGGVSVGDYDYVKKSLEDIGVKLKFLRVAIKPGKPLVFGTFDERLIFGLPGNPVSCLVTFDRFVRPAVLKMSGFINFERKRCVAIAEEALKGSRCKVDFLRGTFVEKKGELLVRTSGPQGSAMLKSFADANCIIIIPEDRDRINAGEEVEVELL